MIAFLVTNDRNTKRVITFQVISYFHQKFYHRQEAMIMYSNETVNKNFSWFHKLYSIDTSMYYSRITSV